MKTTDFTIKPGTLLWMIENEIGNEGIESLSRALLFNTTLNELNTSSELRNNKEKGNHLPTSYVDDRQ